MPGRKKTQHLAQSTESNSKIKTNKTNYATYSGRVSLKPERLASDSNQATIKIITGFNVLS